MSELLRWSLYEITSDNAPLNGVMLRGRLRKFGIESGINVLAENTEDAENGVRFATIGTNDGERVSEYVQSVIAGVSIRLVQEDILNPVLSKLKVNREERYTL